jgi:peroxiredoxin
MKYVFKYLVLLFFISFSANAQPPAETVPDFIFYKLDKTAFTNKSVESDKLLFFVFFDSDCDHCQRAVLDIDQHYSAFKKTAIYLITLDDQEKIKLFMNKYGNNLKDKKNVTVLQDPQYEFMRKFRPRKYPALFLYSTDKKLLLYEDNEQNMFRFLQQINALAK